jgi:hypothetical protein
VRQLTLGLVVSAVTLAGCGKSDIVAVRRPVVPIYLCAHARKHEPQTCSGRFDAGQLIGMRLDDAHRIALAHGFNVQRGAPLTALEQFIEHNTGRSGTNLLRVECDGTSQGSIVVRLMSLER